MVSFILIGLALLSGDGLPWSIRLLMLVGGVASLVAPSTSCSSTQDDRGSSYPYPTQADVLDGDDD